MATNPVTAAAFPSLLAAAVSVANNSATTTSGTNSGSDNSPNLTSMLDQYVAAASTAAAIQQVFKKS